MKLLRTIVLLGAMALMVLGYVASQVAVFGGTASEYASRVDQPPIRLLALLILVGILVCAAIRERGTEESEP